MHRCLDLMLFLAATASMAALPQPRLAFDMSSKVGDAIPCLVSTSVMRVEGGSTQVDLGGLRCTGVQRVVVNPTPAFAASSEITVSAWVASAKAPRGYETILFRGRRSRDGQAVHFSLCLFNGHPEFKFMDEEGQWHGILRNADTMTVPDQPGMPLKEVPRIGPRQWHHLAATFDEGATAVYLDGRKILAGEGAPPRLVPSAQPIRVAEGQSPQGTRAYRFDGLIDRVRLYDLALTPDQVAALVAADRPGKAQGQLDIPAYAPEGYDQDFSTLLPLTRQYRTRKPTAFAPMEACSVTQHRGGMLLTTDGTLNYPMAMMPEPYVSDADVTRSSEDFAAAGVDQYSTILWSWRDIKNGCSGWWQGPNAYDFDRIDRRMRAFIDANPQAMIFPRIKLNPPTWWLEAHPDHLTRSADGTVAEQASLASKAWTEAYTTMLRDLIAHMEQADYSGHIIGYQPAGGGSSEWFWYGKSGDLDFCPAAINRWQQWLRRRYGGDQNALRKAWSNPAASFSRAAPPTPSRQHGLDAGFFRDPAHDRDVLDYARFLSEMTAENIVHACNVVKEATGGRKLAGVFYGYSLYCFDTAGFHGLKTVLQAQSVDFLCAPTAYDYRRGGDPGIFISAYTGSYRLHKKLYWDEVDTRTHLYPQFIHYRTETLGETLAVLRRATGRSLTQGTGLWWFLLAGNATFHQEEVMDDVARMRSWCNAALEADRRSTAEVAVFVDEPSMTAVSRQNRPLHRTLLRDTLDELARMGAPHDVYLLDDMARSDLPDYRLCIFLNAFWVPEDLRDQIRAYLDAPGRTAVWVYAPGFLTDDGPSLESMQQLTGMRFRRHPDPLPCTLTITEPSHPIAAAAPSRLTWPLTLDPVLIPDDDDATVIARVEDLPAVIAKETGARQTVFSLVPLRREILLGLCRYAGVHIYSESFDTLSANRSYVMMHSASPGQKSVHLPTPCSVTELVTDQSSAEPTTEIQLDLPAGVTRIWRLKNP